MNTAATSNTHTASKEFADRIEDRFPRCGFAHLPTPLERLERLSKKLGVNLFIKRDDQTGLAFGGNKTRKLDLIMADVLAQGCDTVITWAGVQSNWCRQTVAAARRVGVKPILVLFKRPNLPSDVDGNYLIDLLFKSDVRIVEVDANKDYMRLADVAEIIDKVVQDEKEKGNKAYVAPIGGSVTEGSMTTPLGSISYASTFAEIVDQACELNFRPESIVLASGSGSTHAGLVVGARLLDPQTKVVGISVSAERSELSDCVREIAEQTIEVIGAKCDALDDIIVYDEYNKDGYGILNEKIAQAIGLVAETEGILLDPVYTGKAMAGLIDLIDQGYFKKGDNIVFLHSGGTPALFPYREQMLGFMKNGERTTTLRARLSSRRNAAQEIINDSI